MSLTSQKQVLASLKRCPLLRLLYFSHHPTLTHKRAVSWHPVPTLTSISSAEATRTEFTRSLSVAEQASSRVQSNLVDRCRSPEVDCRDSATNMTKETRTDQIDLPEDDPETIKLLLRYLYEGEYDPVLPSIATQATTLAVVTPVGYGMTTSRSTSFPHTCQSLGFDGYTCRHVELCSHHKCSSNCKFTCREFTCENCVLPNLNGRSSQLLTHAKMYELADKYEIVGLKELAKEKFNRGCKHFWDTPDFPIAAFHAFSTTPEEDQGLRDCVSRSIATNMQLVRKPKIRALLMKFNGLALGILEAKSKELGWV
jgi:hypothetical protein